MLSRFALAGCRHVIGEDDRYDPSRAEQGLWASWPDVAGVEVEPLALQVDDVISRRWQRLVNERRRLARGRP
jgi:hypothetical protein